MKNYHLALLGARRIEKQMKSLNRSTRIYCADSLALNVWEESYVDAENRFRKELNISITDFNALLARWKITGIKPFRPVELLQDDTVTSFEIMPHIRRVERLCLLLEREMANFDDILELTGATFFLNGEALPLSSQETQILKVLYQQKKISDAPLEWAEVCARMKKLGGDTTAGRPEVIFCRNRELLSRLMERVAPKTYRLIPGVL